MNRPTYPNPCRRRNPRHRAGFSFAEVLFAVMLLGLGFIMVAAIFPVAIRQQTTSMEDTSGVAVAKRSAVLIQQVGTAFAQYNPAGTGGTYGNFFGVNQDDPTKVYSIGSAVAPAKSRPVLVRFQAAPAGGGVVPYQYIKGDMIQQTDRRLAWMPVAYASKLGSPYADVYIVAVQSRANEQFTDNDRDKSELATDLGPFVPVDCAFKLVEGGTSYPDTLVFTNGVSGAPMELPAAAEGAFVWVADDNVTTTPSSTATYKAPDPGASNGRFYRLGIKRDDMGPGVWELQSGYDMSVTTTAGPDNDWNTTSDNQEQNENLPPRLTDNPHPLSVGASGYASISGSGSSSAARGLLVGRGRERDASGNYTNLAGNAMTIYALPPVTVRIQP